MTRLSQRPAAAWIALGVGVAAYIAAMYPGAVYTDTAGLLLQGHTGDYLNWHSPTLAFVLSLLQPILPGPAAMLAPSAVLLGSGLYLTARAAGMGRMPAALAAGLIPLTPAVFSALFWTSKDSAGIAALMLGMGLALGARSRARLAAAAAALVFAGMVRLDYLPLGATVMAVALFRRSASSGRPLRLRAVRGAAAAAAFAAGGLALTSLFVHQVLKAREVFVLQAVLNHDLAAISLARDRLIAPKVLQRQGWDMEFIRSHYSPASADPLIWPADRPAIAYTTDEADHREIAALWLGAVAGSPGAYARHRLAVFGHLLGISSPPKLAAPNADWAMETTAAYCREALPHLPLRACAYAGSPIGRAVLAAAGWAQRRLPVLFHQTTYVALCAAALVFGARRRALVLLALGGVPLAHLGVLLFVAPSNEWRYTLTVAVCGLLGLCVIVSGWPLRSWIARATDMAGDAGARGVKRLASALRRKATH